MPFSLCGPPTRMQQPADGAHGVADGGVATEALASEAVDPRSENHLVQAARMQCDPVPR